MHQVGIKTDILDILKHLCDAWILVEICNSKIYSESENDLVDNVKDLGATVVLEFLQRSPSLFPDSLKTRHLETCHAHQSSADIRTTAARRGGQLYIFL